MKKILLLIVCLGITVSLIFPYHSHADTDNSNAHEIELSITPDDFLFNIENMKPGDWAPRTLTINNSGSSEFEYQMSVENNGNDKLFNELLLLIEDVDQNKLYDGKISEFSSIPSRYLDAENHEDLHITVTFPEHLGNEFQGVSSSFSFIFYAEGDTIQGNKDNDVAEVSGLVENDNGDSNNQLLPNTATSIFSILLLGLLIVSVGLFVVIWQKYKSIPK
ncbi:TasA family protein [Oceanobacillus kimchii]|uniref:TasA family protein n=1 Tax=Oceanobacillus kimchii TaxID=746691 RepID=UPI0023300FAB|nr:TasA family protein [Oceanobacillus kimchii]